MMADLTRDLRYAVRTFRRAPAFAAGVVLTFALVIGANAAMFGLVQRLMLAPPPGIQDAERVVRVGMSYATDDGGTFTMATTSYPTFERLAALGSAFDGVAAVATDSVAVGRAADLSEVAAVEASGQYFATLGVRPALGRLFGPSDDVLPNGNDVVVLGYAYWQRQFAGDEGVLGRQVLVDDQLLTVVGVTPRGFNGTELSTVDLYVPLTTALRKREPGWWSNPLVRMVAIVARLRGDVAPATASAMALRGVQEINPGARDRLAGIPLESVVPGRSARETPQARIALWLSAVSLVVLLIATANVGTLLLLRAARRRREVAVRITLGARMAHLARQMVVESLLLALGGCAIGLLLARWFADVIRVTLLPNVASGGPVSNPTVLAVSIATACLAGLIAGLAPVTRLRRRDLARELRAGGGHGASGRFAFQHVLLAVQVALSVMLLVGAGLFVRSLRRVETQDLGFSTARLLLVTLDYLQPLRGPERDRAHEDAVRRIGTIPGVTGATIVQGMPFSSHNIPPIHIPGYELPPPTAQQLPIMYAATPAYLDLMGVKLVAGRLFTARDTTGTPLVVLVNETMARTAWPGERAIGRCVQAGHGPDLLGGDPMQAAAYLPCRMVVGVVRDSRARSLRTEGGEATLMQYYVPFGQLPPAPFPDVPNVHAILVRTAGDPGRWVAPVQRMIQETSGRAVHARARPYQALLDPQLRSWRLGATLFTAFGLLALGIASLGLVAVVSYLVAQRTQEIGVRLALGGSSARIRRLVIGDALRMAAVGGAAGLGAALVAAPLVRPLLFETSPHEPVVLAAAVVTLLAVTVCAASVPAWRASRVSPMTVLREDA